MEFIDLNALIKQPKKYPGGRPWIAIFDLKVTKNSPAGSCVLAEVLGLADEFDITVFSDAFDNDQTGRVHWVRVPLPSKPGFLRYMFFNLLAPRALRRHSAQRGAPPALIQATQGQFIGADICYAHFCHRAYLKNQWQFQKAHGLRRLARWVANQYNAITEQLSFRSTRLVVSPSQGLLQELTATYPFLKDQIYSIPNPVDTDFFARPKEFDRAPILMRLGLPVDARVLCFAALGDFSRKGLSVLMKALSGIDDESVWLLVVGGNAGEVATFTAVARDLGVVNRVVFTGFQSDVRPYLWVSDLFLLPSTYEIFPLVVIQAMAAGVPAIVTRLHGVAEYVVHGENAWFVERTPESVRAAIVDALVDKDRLISAGGAAYATAQQYNQGKFVEAWRECIHHVLTVKSDDSRSSFETELQP